MKYKLFCHPQLHLDREVNEETGSDIRGMHGEDKFLPLSSQGIVTRLPSGLCLLPRGFLHSVLNLRAYQHGIESGSLPATVYC
jgi:hypothetical protein